MRSDLLTQTRTAAFAVNIESVKQLSGVLSDLNTPDYRRIKEQLTLMRATNPDSRFLYLLAMKNGDVIILIDSEPPESADYSPPGQVYEEASKNVRRLFDTVQETTVGPDSDRWGTWISGFIPLKDSSSENLVAFFGMDISADSWSKQLQQRRLLPISATLLLGLFALGLLCLCMPNPRIQPNRIHSTGTCAQTGDASRRGIRRAGNSERRPPL